MGLKVEGRRGRYNRYRPSILELEMRYAVAAAVVVLAGCCACREVASTGFTFQIHRPPTVSSTALVQPTALNFSPEALAAGPLAGPIGATAPLAVQPPRFRLPQPPVVPDVATYGTIPPELLLELLRRLQTPVMPYAAPEKLPAPRKCPTTCWADE